MPLGFTISSDMRYSRQDSLASFEKLVDSVDDLAEGGADHKHDSRKTSRRRSRTVNTV